MRIFETNKAAHTPRIRVINLVDILFILLIFFIATSTFRVESPPAVKVSLPEAQTAEAVGREKVDRVTVTLAADETMYVDEKPMAVQALEARLVAAREANPSVVVEIKADETVSYGRLMRVIDAARAAKITNLTAFTKPRTVGTK
jgi:biopolymer transport protein ExbD